MSLLIVSWAFIAVAVRLEQDSGSVVANAAVGRENLTAVVGTHGSDRGVLSRADLAISPRAALAVAAAAYLPRVIGFNRHGTVPAASGGLEAIQARTDPGNNVAKNTLQDLFTPVPSDQGVTDNLSGQTVEEFVATNHELQKDAEDINSVANHGFSTPLPSDFYNHFGQTVEKIVAANHELQKDAEDISHLMVDTLSSVEAPEDKLVALADKLMKLGKMMVQHSHPSLIYENIAPKASQSETSLKMAGRRFVDNTLKKVRGFDGDYEDLFEWKSNMRRLEKVLGFGGDYEDFFDYEGFPRDI